MSASRKLYTGVAERLKRNRPADIYPEALGQWRLDVIGIALVMKLDNSGFDKPKFLTASGFTDAERERYGDLL